MAPSDFTFLAIIVWNVICFFLMSLDKARAVAGKTEERISEKTFFVLALLFGSLGIYGGMYAFRHKTKKWYFQVGVPLIMALQWLIIFGLSY